MSSMRIGVKSTKMFNSRSKSPWVSNLSSSFFPTLCCCNAKRKQTQKSQSASKRRERRNRGSGVQ